jgi:protein-tyrosine-phosphatase
MRIKFSSFVKSNARYQSNLTKRVIILTVGTKIQQTLASAESITANLKSFSLDTDNQQAKQSFQQLAQQMDTIVQQLKSREQIIMSEEPQYKQ